MSRTFRRKNQEHEYQWVLRDWDLFHSSCRSICHDVHSQADRKVIAVFHSDAQRTMSGSAPRWYRKIFDKRRRIRNDEVMRKWLKNPELDPVFEVNHRHDAKWSWW